MGRGRDRDLVRKMASRELAPQIVIGARVRRVFSRDIAVEGSTEGNVQHLAAPADTEGRLVVGSSPADNVDLRHITRPINALDQGRIFHAVERSVYVAA